MRKTDYLIQVKGQKINYLYKGMRILIDAYCFIFIAFFILTCGQTKTDNIPIEGSSDTLVYDTSPRWMTPENKVFFYTYRHDAKGAELYSIYPDGTELTRMTETYQNEWWSDYSPINEVFYVSSDLRKADRFGGSEIFALDANGIYKQITFSSDSSNFNVHPRISPDGKQLLYCSNCIGQDVNSEIILIDLESRQTLNLTMHDAADKSGSWSPDGEKVLFQSNRSGRYQLYILDLKTLNLDQLTNNDGDNIHGDWSTKNKIVFISNIDGDNELFTINPDGAEQQQLTFNTVRDVLPSWSPDGEMIAFASYRYGKKDKGDIFLIKPDGTNEFRLTKR